MIEINLLPKEYQKRKFRVTLEKNTLYVIGSGLLVLILLSAYSVIFQVLPSRDLSKKINEARIEAQNYDSEIALIKELTEKKNLILARMRTIEELDHDRDLWVKVISDLSSRIPNYLWLTNFSKQATAETEQAAAADGGLWHSKIEGKSFSINSLATFLIRLKKSPYLENIEITKIELDLALQQAKAYNFAINCDLKLGGYDNVDLAQSAGKQIAKKNESNEPLAKVRGSKRSQQF
jgi:Tfp pilus assembly protein PilN